MNKRELKQRGKGLLALMLAFLMMLGTSMTVLAANIYELNGESNIGLSVTIMNGGDTIRGKAVSGSTLTVVIDGREYTENAGRDEYMHAISPSFTLPSGCRYKVEDCSMSPIVGTVADYSYRVVLSTISLPQSGGSNAGSPEAVDSLQEEPGNGGGKPHTHYYTWVTAREATKDMDGLEEYKCACGVVAEQVIMPAGQAVVKGFCKAVREAAADGSVSYDTRGFCTMSDKMVACLAERTDVTVELTFIYQKTPYRMTIPAGSDYSALLADESMFYGYFCFADQIGAQIEPVS